MDIQTPIHIYTRTDLQTCLCGESVVSLQITRGHKTNTNTYSAQYVIFRERALIFVALLRNMTCNLRHPVGLCQPVHRDARIHMHIHIHMHIWGGYH